MPVFDWKEKYAVFMPVSLNANEVLLVPRMWHCSSLSSWKFVIYISFKPKSV